MRLFDTHAHLDDESFSTDRDAVVSRAEAAGLGALLAVGTTAQSSLQCVDLARKYSIVSAAVGIQPNYVAEVASGDWDQVVRLAEAHKVVALGETGLDRYWDFTPFSTQEDYFDRHLRLSQKTGLPFIVHMRECGDDILRMLTEARLRGELQGVMHSFTGDRELATACLELGLYISFAGMVTFKKSAALRSVAAQIPADRILIETDAPYLSPHPKRSQRPNEPALIVHTLACLAAERNVAEDQFADQTFANGHRLFSRMPR
ncbi:MAG: TatD family hydrolase [Planctomycetota bacterium]|nr:TatD family hydrolase [Planctomycetota bacterium]